MEPDELDLLSRAPSRALLLAMDKQRRMTPRHSALKPNIDDGEIEMRFDGEPVTAHFYNLPRAEVARLAANADAPGSPKEVLGAGDVVFSLEMLKGVIIARVLAYRKHLKLEDYRAIFTRGPMPDLRDEPAAIGAIPVPAQLI